MGRKATGNIEARPNNIRLRYTYMGQRQVETLDLAPTPANIKAAERLLARIQSAIQAGVYRRADFFETSDAAPENPTFGEWADKWLAMTTVDHGTFKHYKHAIDHVWKPAFGDKLIASVRHSDIQAVVAARMKVVSGKTVNNDLIPLRQTFRSALKDEVIKKDPSATIEKQKHQKPKPDPFTPDEMEAILADLKERAPTQVWAYFEFAFCTGLRTSELIIARWGKVDWNRASITVDIAKTYGRVKSTKTKTERDVDLTPRALAALSAMKPFTFMKGPDHPIFENPTTGKPWATDEYQRTTYFVPTLRRLGIRHRPAYNTRHTYATIALMGGVNPAYIARQLGHVNTVMLLTVYSKWLDEADRGRESSKLATLQAPQLAQNWPGRASND